MGINNRPPHHRFGLPAWPVVPPRLWLTGAASLVLGISLCFTHELWRYHPLAGVWSKVLLGVLLQWGGVQAINVLINWLVAYAGSRWVRLLMAFLVVGLGTFIAVLLVEAFLCTCSGIYLLLLR
jgi:hypothetical protein